MTLTISEPTRITNPPRIIYVGEAATKQKPINGFKQRAVNDLNPALAKLLGKITTPASLIVNNSSVNGKPHEEIEYLVPANATILVEDGQLIAAGTQIASGRANKARHRCCSTSN